MIVLLDLQVLLQVRAEVNLVLDAARHAKIIGSSLEAAVEVTVPKGTRLAEVIDMLTVEELAELFIVSHGTLILSDGDSIPEPSAMHSTDDAVVATSMVSAPRNVSPHEQSVPLTVGVSAAGGSKCGRCWRIMPELVVFEGAELGGQPTRVCTRCNFA